MKKTLSIVATAIAVMSQPALAGNLDEPAANTAPTPSFQLSSPNWTGFYVGGQVGYADGDTDLAGVGSDEAIGGFIAGYDYDLGRTVVGVGVDYDFTDLEVSPGVDIQNIFRARVRGGYKIGDGLAYLTGGYANADANGGGGSDDGYFIGAGYEHLITDQISVGAEILYQEFSSFDGTSNDVDATTFQLRASFRF